MSTWRGPVSHFALIIHNNHIKHTHAHLHTQESGTDLCLQHRRSQEFVLEGALLLLGGGALLTHEWAL